MPTAIVVGSTFAVDPPRGGGQLRLLNLCRALATLCPVQIIALTDADDASAGSVTLAPGLVQHRVAKTDAHTRAELELEREAGIPVTDIAFAELHELTPNFSAAVATAMRPGAAVLACHPYPLPALTVAAPDAPLLYDAQDVAVDLKAGMLRPNAVAEQLLATTRSVEQACCERAALVLPVSDRDGARLRELYEVPEARIAVTPNGVDTAAVRFTAIDERRAIRNRLRLPRPLALFLGSWHEPNLAAVRHVVRFAPDCPRVDFLIAGSACLPFREVDLPGNVSLLGVVPDGLRDTLLATVDLALNPMSSGSGSNIKMLDYLAAGAPVICTDVGARGLDLEFGEVRVASVPEFPSAITEVLGQTPEALDQQVRAARRVVQERFDWSAIGEGLIAAVGQAMRVAGI